MERTVHVTTTTPPATPPLATPPLATPPQATPPIHPAGSRRVEAAYAGLLALGIAVPYAQVVPWLAEHGLDVDRFLAELLAGRISRFFGWDVITAAGTLVVLAAVDPELRPGQRWLVAAGSLAGASVGLPLYLLVRERNRNRAPR